MRLTILTPLFLTVSHMVVCGNHVDRGFISDIASVFGGGGSTSTSTPDTPAPHTAGPPAKQSVTSSSASTITSGPSFVTSYLTLNLTSTVSVNSTAPTSTSSSISITPGPSVPANSEPTAAPKPSNPNSISGAGIAVAIILTFFTIGLVAWVVFRYHPRSRTWWAARQERKFQERSYRDALDGPGAMSNGGRGGRGAYLASFFAPGTARLGGGKEIRRKPVNWGASEDKLPLTDISSLSGGTYMFNSHEEDEKVPPLPSAYQKPLPPPK